MKLIFQSNRVGEETLPLDHDQIKYEVDWWKILALQSIYPSICIFVLNVAGEEDEGERWSTMNNQKNLVNR